MRGLIAVIMSVAFLVPNVWNKQAVPTQPSIPAESTENSGNVQTKPAEERVNRGGVAYVVSGRVHSDIISEKTYAELVLINETGRFEAVTVDDVENYNFMPVFTEKKNGKLTDWEGKIVLFDMKKTDKIQMLENRREVKREFDGEDGFYRVNIVGERNGVVSFYNTNKAVEKLAETSAEALPYCEKGYAVISISDGEYRGTSLNKISAKAESLPAGGGNAIIQVKNREIVRIFSFDE